MELPDDVRYGPTTAVPDTVESFQEALIDGSRTFVHKHEPCATVPEDSGQDLPGQGRKSTEKASDCGHLGGFQTRGVFRSRGRVDSDDGCKEGLIKFTFG